MALSTYLPLSGTVEAERHKANHDLPIFMAHGRFDDIIPILVKIARTGEIGDGRIFVSPVDEAYHVRTGFMDR